MCFQKYNINLITEKLNNAGFYPLDILLVGATGVGKSSTLNALFGSEVAKVGAGVAPETMNIDSYKLNNVLRFWDSAGLGDGREADQIHTKNLTDILNKTYKRSDEIFGYIDLVVVILDGSQRDLGTVYRLLEQVILKNIDKNRVLVWINQADMAMKGRYWNYQSNQPEYTLKQFLDTQAQSIQERLKESTGLVIDKPIYYSAEYSYNLVEIMDSLIKHIPNSRRKLLLPKNSFKFNWVIRD